MFLLSLLKNLFNTLKRVIVSSYQLAVLEKKYPLCRFHTGAFISNTSFEKYNIVFEDVIIDSCVVGAHSYIQKKSSIFNATIGKFCSIASNVSIGPGIHQPDGVSTHPVFFIQNTPLICKFAVEDHFKTSKKISIGHDVWIGERATILDGITIGTGAIIAAGAVVTKDIEPYAIVGGVPAKHIKYRFDEETISKLLQSRWWDRSEQALRANHKLFEDVESFLKYENN